jgi:hypothetical protein
LLQPVRCSDTRRSNTFRTSSGSGSFSSNLSSVPLGDGLSLAVGALAFVQENRKAGVRISQPFIVTIPRVCLARRNTIHASLQQSPNLGLRHRPKPSRHRSRWSSKKQGISHPLAPRTILMQLQKQPEQLLLGDRTVANRRDPKDLPHCALRCGIKDVPSSRFVRSSHPSLSVSS